MLRKHGGKWNYRRFLIQTLDAGGYHFEASTILILEMTPFLYMYVCMHVCMCVGFKTLFYVVRRLDSTASYLPTGLHLGFFRSWPSLYLPSSFSSVFVVLSFVSASTSMLFWVIFLLPSLDMAVPCKLVLFNFFYNWFL